MAGLAAEILNNSRSGGGGGGRDKWGVRKARSAFSESPREILRRPRSKGASRGGAEKEQLSRGDAEARRLGDARARRRAGLSPPVDIPGIPWNRVTGRNWRSDYHLRDFCRGAQRLLDGGGDWRRKRGSGP